MFRFDPCQATGRLVSAFVTLLAGLLWTASASAQPAALRGVVLQDQHSQPVLEQAFKGRPLLLHFILTTCSATCPLQVHDLAQLRLALPDDVRATVRFLSVSVDPLQDTPASLTAFARRLGADQPGWQFATGQPAQVERLLDRMQVLKPSNPAQPEQPEQPARPAKPGPGAQQRLQDHRTALYLFGADGQLLQRYAGVPVDKPRLRDELTAVARAMPAAAVASARR